MTPYQISCWLWIAWYVFWVISARRRLRTGKTQREPWLGRVGYLSLMVLGFVQIFGRAPQILRIRFLPVGLVFGFAGLLIQATGLAFAIWARQILGKNWSGRIATSGAQKLITSRGPYRFVRHPIYSGLLLAVFGTVFIVGELRALLGSALVICGVLLKLRREESALRNHFGPSYEEYAHRVPALVPFVKQRFG